MPEQAVKQGDAGAVCAVCGGTGWKIIERDGISGAERCECALRARPKRIEESAGIPAKYRDKSFENFIIPEPHENPQARESMARVLLTLKAYVREYPVRDRPGLLLVGSTGTGKTHLAVAVLRGLIARGYDGVFFDYQELFEKIRSGYDPNSGTSSREAYRTALEAEILLVDDLGAHRYKEWVEDTITSIITYRYNNNKPLIATTNLPDDDRVPDYKTAGETVVYKKSLAEVIGLRSRSRLHEMCRVIRMPAVEDFRLRRRG
jgi:DNA replication protein DnaC